MNSSIETSGPSPDGKIIDDQTTNVLLLLNIVSIYAIVCSFGVCTNVINLVVFVKQGLRDTVNMTLFGLAIADMGSLLALLLMSLCYNPVFLYSDIVPFKANEVSYLLSGMPRVCFTRIISWCTAFISFERCICVLFPLKVRTLITPTRTKWVLITIYVTMAASLIPVYYTTRMDWKFYPGRNKTLLGLVFIKNREMIDRLTFGLGSFIAVCSFLCVSVCTLVLIVGLKKKSKWRQQSTMAGKSEGASERDKRIGKMVAIISSIFIITFLPINAIQIGMSLEPEFGKGKRYTNIFHVSWSFAYIFEAISSTVNIFIYLKMSSKYKETFYQVFPFFVKSKENEQKTEDRE
ncbi:probable G-protein coupled receptor B0563.6 [Aplysia californica]|uniref:Probable G-protein coupled receptor B0563.6 n=1 Tax=Aplysia californica TaxID=6500 RepID=A0ABM0K918_APLCA|nr:probable G-protein coupled receptor B0563.6 [Aplysia californica]